MYSLKYSLCYNGDMKFILTVFLLFAPLFAFEKVAIILGSGSMKLSDTTQNQELSFTNFGALITYPWFETDLVSSILFDISVYESSNFNYLNPTASSTPHDFGIITTLGFNLGYIYDNDWSLYGGLKYSTNQIVGVSGEGLAVSANLEYDFTHELGMGLAYKKGVMQMYLADERISYTSWGLYLTFRQEER